MPLTRPAGASTEASVQNAPPGLVGTINVRIEDGLNAVVFGPTTAGIVESGIGIYTVTFTAPSTTGQYLIIWNDGAGSEASEDLTVVGVGVGGTAIGPDLAGYAGAQAAHRQRMGVDVVFLQGVSVTFPPGTPMDPETGLPYDPTLVPTASAQASAVVRCNVARSAVRNARDGLVRSSAMGFGDAEQITCIADLSASAAIDGAVEFLVNSARFKVVAMNVDEPVAGAERIVVMGRPTERNGT